MDVETNVIALPGGAIVWTVLACAARAAMSRSLTEKR